MFPYSARQPGPHQHPPLGFNLTAPPPSLQPHHHQQLPHFTLQPLPTSAVVPVDPLSQGFGRGIQHHQTFILQQPSSHREVVPLTVPQSSTGNVLSLLAGAHAVPMPSFVDRPLQPQSQLQMPVSPPPTLTTLMPLNAPGPSASGSTELMPIVSVVPFVHLVPPVCPALPPPEENTNLYVYGFGRSSNVDELFLYKTFSPFGAIASVKLMVDVHTGQSKGFGFVRFQREADARNAMNTLQNISLGSKTLHISVHRQREPTTSADE